jgi:hypothetical protein
MFIILGSNLVSVTAGNSTVQVKITKIACADEVLIGEYILVVVTIRYSNAKNSILELLITDSGKLIDFTSNFSAHPLLQ